MVRNLIEMTNSNQARAHGIKGFFQFIKICVTEVVGFSNKKVVGHPWLVYHHQPLVEDPSELMLDSRY